MRQPNTILCIKREGITKDIAQEIIVNPFSWEEKTETTTNKPHFYHKQANYNDV